MKPGDIDHSLYAGSEEAEVIEAISEYYKGASTAEEGVPVAFLDRCVRAADVALTLAKLGVERARVGFVPLPFGEYVQGLASVAGVPLAPVLTWASLESLEDSSPTSAFGFARLAQTLGFSLRETLAQIQIGFAERVGKAPVPMLASYRRRGLGHRESLQEFEDILHELRQTYSSEKIDELKQIESAVRDVYSYSAEWPH